MASARVLLIDDDPEFVSNVQSALKPSIECRVISRGECALDDAASWLPDVVILNLLLDGIDGFDLLDQLRQLDTGMPPFILCTTNGPGSETRVSPIAGFLVGTIARTSTLSDIQRAILHAISLRSSGSELVLA